MARVENSFALLLDDESDDIAALLASSAAKSAVPEKKPEPTPPPPAPAKLPSKLLPPAEAVKAERGRGRGGRGRGFGRGGVDSGSGGWENGYFDDARARPNAYQRDARGDHDGKPFEEGGRGRGRGHGRGRGRGRDFHDDREFGNENQAYGNEGGDNQVNDGGERKDYEDVSRPFRKENRPYGNENRGFGGERRNYKGGERAQYGGSGQSGYRRTDGWNAVEQKQPESDENKKPVAGFEATGWDVPEATEVPKVDVENKSELLDSHDTVDKKAEEEGDKEMTLDEYEKVLSEKRKALQALKTEERKVTLDKDLLKMQLLEKKKDDDNVLKLTSEKEKLKKKDSLDKEEKVRKSVSINEFLKPADGERYIGPSRGRGGRGRGRGERGGLRGGFVRRSTGADNIPAPSIEDPSQFPQLGGNEKTSV